MENPYHLIREDRTTSARRGYLDLPRGRVETPAFMPVGTQGAIKAMTPEQMKRTGAGIVLANTYHLSYRPGEFLVKKLGGLHEFSGWDGTMLTDSGGYQVFSIKKKEILEEGVRFSYSGDGASQFFSPSARSRSKRTWAPTSSWPSTSACPTPAPRTMPTNRWPGR